MALSYQSAVSDGTLAYLDVSFQFLSRDNVFVYLDDALTTAWSWSSSVDNRIVFNTPVPNGVEVTVRRVTETATLRHEFSKGAAFTEQTLDEDLRQALFIAQEAYERPNEVGTPDFYSTVNMHGNRITNMGAGTNPQDAVTVQQMAAAIAAGSTGYVIPDVTGKAGKLLSNDGVGTLVWSDAPESVDTELDALQYVPEELRDGIRAFTATADVSTYVQAAINFAAIAGIRKVRLSSGRWPIAPASTLRTYYDATLNPTYPRIRNAHVELVGDGMDSEASGTGTPGNLCGTLIWSDPATPRTAPLLIASPASEDALPYFGRDFVARDLSIDGNSTGHLVVCRGVPGARFFNVQVRQRNRLGSGIDWGTGYIGGLHGCRIVNSDTGTKTGDGITLSASIEAGLYTIDQETISNGFAYGLRVTSGTVQQLNIHSAQLTGTVGGIFVVGAGTASVETLNVTGGYGEGTCEYWIKGGSEGIRMLNINGGFVYGAGFTQAAIQIDKPDSVLISGVRVQDLAGTFLNVASLPSLSHNAMAVRGVHFYYTSPITTLRTLFTGVLPALELIEWPEGNANCRLCDTQATPIRTLPLFATNSSMQVAGHFRATSVGLQSPAVNGTTYFHAAQGYPARSYFGGHTSTIVFELNKGSTAKLGDGFSLWIVNRGSGAITVTRAGLGTTIVSVPANTKVQLIWSDFFDDWH